MRRMALVLAALAGGAQAAPGGRVVAELRDGDGWQVAASEQVEAALRREADGSVCLEYDFHSVSGYAVLRHALPVQWPAAFALQLRMRGLGSGNDLQVKLVDASGDNVWWVNRPSFPLPRSLADVTFKNRHFRFAWGPTADRHLARTESLELVVAARQGGQGTLCVAEVRVQEREPDPAVWPEPLVRSRAGTLDLDYRRAREFNGVTLQWPGPARPVELRPARLGGRPELEALAAGGAGAGRVRGPLPPGDAKPGTSGSAPARTRPAPQVELRDAGQWPDLNAAPLRARPARAARARAAGVPRRAELLDAGGRGWRGRALGAPVRGRGAGDRARRVTAWSPPS